MTTPHTVSVFQDHNLGDTNSPLLANPLPPPQDCSNANTSDKCTEVVRGTSSVHDTSLPLLPPLDEKFSDNDSAASTNYHVRLLQNDITGNNNATTTPLKTPEEDRSVGFESGFENIEKNSTEYIASPPSKFPLQQPKNPTMMKNHNELLFDKGYDSDNNLPYFDNVSDMGDNPDQYYEDPIQFSHPLPPSNDTANLVNAKIVSTPQMTAKEAKALNISQLNEELKKRGCPVSGKKVELQHRLLEALKNNIPVGLLEDVSKRDANLNGLAPTAFWQLLTKELVPVPEPQNEDCSLRPPTEMDGGMVNPKYAFVETFEHPEFTGQTERVLPMTQGGKKKRKRARKISPPCDRNE